MIEARRGGGRDETRVGVLISGRGSNMVSLARSCADGAFPARVVVVVSNVPGAPGLERAAELGIPTATVDHRRFEDRADFEARLLQALREHGAEVVCLAGFMRLLTPGFVGAWRGRLLNVHPSLLPAFPGLDAQRQALEYGVRYSGCTVHLVTEEMDSGPIVLQAVVPVLPDDTVERLSARILEQEHRIYPRALRLLAEDRLRVRGRRVEILAADD